MKQSNVVKLEKYRYVLEGRSFTPCPGYDLNEVLEVIHEEFDAGYKVDWHCGGCLMRMVEDAFRWMENRLNTNIKIKF